MTPTEVPAGTAWLLIVGATLWLIAVPILRQLTDGHRGLRDAIAAVPSSDPARPDGLLASSQRLLRSLEAVEDSLETGSPLRGAALPAIQWALLRFGGVGNETVYVAGANPSWLVLRSGFDHTTGHPFLDADVLERRRRSESSAADLEPDPRPALLDLHRQLESRGIRLIVLPVPSKAAVVPEALGARRMARPARNPSTDILIETLREAGIEVFDPSPRLESLGREAFLRTDSHWSPSAVDAVAEDLATELESRLDFGPQDRDWERAPLERRARGDLWRALALPTARPLFPEETVEVQEVTSWDGLLWQATRGAPVLLLGDSFSTVYSDEGLHWGSGAGLAEQLAYHLGRDVDRLARPDGASDQVRQDLARQPDRLGGVRVVIYQMATREFSTGDWPLISLGG